MADKTGKHHQTTEPWYRVTWKYHGRIGYSGWMPYSEARKIVRAFNTTSYVRHWVERKQDAK